MKKKLPVAFFFLLMGCLLFKPAAIKAQWRVDTTIVRALCDEQGGKGGSVFLKISGVPGPYTFSWSNGFSGDSIVNVASGLYSVLVSNNSGKDTTVLIPVRQWGCDPEPAMSFTPNGDGIHDTWNISNTAYYPELLVTVYNRWGQMVWEHKGWYTPWDGSSYLGLPVEGGAYFWVIYEKASDKSQGTLTGSVTIIR